MKKIQQALLLLSVTTMTGLVGCQTISAKLNHNHHNADASAQVNEDAQEIRNINQVTWHKSEKVTDNYVNTDMSDEQSRLVFIRLADDGDRFTSTNVGIDNRFQVSLQGSRYSEVVTCAGEHELSVQNTGNLSNDLAVAAQIYQFDPEQTYYFLVTPQNGISANLSPLQPAQAQQMLGDMQRQTHQISRVSNDCEPKATQPIAAAAVVSMPDATVTQAEVAEEKETTKVQIEQPINVEILFDFDSANIQPNYYPHLESVAAFMQQHPNVRAMIEGHTDSRGPAAYNKGLSARRADAVKQMLVTKFGIDVQRLSSVGYGESQPVSSNATAEGRQQNRRVIATVMNTNSGK